MPTPRDRTALRLRLTTTGLAGRGPGLCPACSIVSWRPGLPGRTFCAAVSVFAKLTKVRTVRRGLVVRHVIIFG